MQSENRSKSNSEPSLFYLLYTFLSIGSMSFGGYSSLVAMVKEKLVDKKRLLNDAIILEGFTLASLLPGPVAVNTVAFIGFYLRGWLGAVISFVAVILPSFVFVVALTHFYLIYAEIPAVSGLLKGVTPVILAIILSVSYKLGKGHILTYKHIIILVIGLAVQVVWSGYLSFVICLLIGGLVGVFLLEANTEESKRAMPQAKNSYTLIKPLFVILLIVVPLVFWIGYNNNLNTQLALTFGKVSLTLFGGGYVMIPILEDILVVNLEWLTTQEFVDAIAIGQVTPGPILISAAFVGYKLNGVLGAAIATFFIFTPSSLLMILLSAKVEHVKNNIIWQKAMNGIKPMVISFILYSIWVIFSKIDYLEVAVPIFIIAAVLLVKYKVNFVYLVIASALLGIFIF